MKEAKKAGSLNEGPASTTSRHSLTHRSSGHFLELLSWTDLPVDTVLRGSARLDVCGLWRHTSYWESLDVRKGSERHLQQLKWSVCLGGRPERRETKFIVSCKYTVLTWCGLFRLCGCGLSHRSQHHLSGGLLCQHGNLHPAVGELHLRLLHDLLHWHAVQWP